MRLLTSFFLLLCSCTLTIAQTDCPNPHDSNSDGAVTISDLLDLLGLFGDVDIDQDGVWDSVDDCLDTSACNYTVNPTENCAYIDVLGVCGGGCNGDEDGDGICDDVDPCFGQLDECGICNGPGPSAISIESITILYDSVFAEAIDQWLIFEVGADTVFNVTCSCGDPISYQGYDYSTVLIGEQCWFAENLRSTEYRNGDNIPAPIQADWSSATDGGRTVYGKDPVGCCCGQLCDEVWTLNEYGRLYNYHAVEDPRNLCPTGFHVPSALEWGVLIDYLGGQGEEETADKMKMDNGWASGVGNGSNESGFSAVPAGDASSYDMSFNGATQYTWWWASSQAETPMQADAVVLSSIVGITDVGTDIGWFWGHSVRCIQD